MNITLTPELDALVRRKVESGMYQSASEVIREALRRLQSQATMREQQYALLKDDIHRGIDQLDAGRGTVFDAEAAEALIRRGEARLSRGREFARERSLLATW